MTFSRFLRDGAVQVACDLWAVARSCFV
jgi:hypothetical protein